MQGVGQSGDKEEVAEVIFLVDMTDILGNAWELRRKVTW